MQIDDRRAAIETLGLGISVMSYFFVQVGLYSEQEDGESH